MQLAPLRAGADAALGGRAFPRSDGRTSRRTVFTSATLAVNEQMTHFKDRTGVHKAQSMILNSPFDYARQALLCVPRDLPSPNQPGGARQLARRLLPLIEANNGRCFSSAPPIR